MFVEVAFLKSKLLDRVRIEEGSGKGKTPKKCGNLTKALLGIQ